MRGKRTDRNHAEIGRALKAAGCTVVDTSGVGGGFGDYVVGYAGKTAILEVKDANKSPSKRALTEAQLGFHATWRGGTLAVVCDVESAIRVARTMESTGNT